MRRLIVVFWVVGLTVSCASSTPVSSVSPSQATITATATPTQTPSVTLVFTTWVPDANVANGPEPGYKPAFSGLTRNDLRSANAVIDATGTSWLVYISFTANGTNLFAKLTRDNVSACPGDAATEPSANCALRHLAIWLDLTQTDIDNWDDPNHAAKVSQPFDFGCLARMTATAVCPKLVSDPITLQEIDGGNVAIAGNFTQQTANEFARAITMPHF